MARKMYREAIESYEEAPQDSAIIWNKVGIAYHQMMQLDAAMKRYRRAIKLDAKYSEAINNLGTIYYAEKHYGKAIGYYKRALKLAPGSASMYSNLGTAYFAEKKFKMSWEAYNKALPTRSRGFRASQHLRRAAAGPHRRAARQVSTTTGQDLRQEGPERSCVAVYPEGARRRLHGS